jgi:hypothetical protein
MRGQCAELPRQRRSRQETEIGLNGAAAARCLEPVIQMGGDPKLPISTCWQDNIRHWKQLEHADQTLDRLVASICVQRRAPLLALRL